ncbi:MAG: Heat shock protein Hsp20 [Deltaproteobacteria bacterium]|nr:Heat shock protein Hsp20 [Deltaproteobacteria bacterium]
MAIVRFWDPMKELSSLQNRMNRVFEETFGSPLYRGEQPGAGTWSPAVDIFETGDEIVVKAEVPGVAKRLGKREQAKPKQITVDVK